MLLNMMKMMCFIYLCDLSVKAHATETVGFYAVRAKSTLILYPCLMLLTGRVCVCVC